MTGFSTIILFPKILVVVYNSITKGKNWLEVINIVQLILQSFFILIPALFAEMVYNETDKIKLCVTKQLLVCKDAQSRDAVEDAVRFLEQRRFRYTVWRLFTLDITLIFTVVGMITTYTVAMIQFAHFYD
ncbi:hypothetical protein PYW08_015635 [Mythimna loreyi]|uniref:Uncharacterized protein n=1 Tax=Mythimna loreyi TaxID=667449 RepID=A0ACC2QW50_9NEOP|nr:hypothetical protein PYW08_015635 [Mythimna loreyi]